MVLMKAQDKQQLAAMRVSCGQERDLQVKQVEGGYVIQSVTRFFMDQDGTGPVSVGEMSDTAVAVSAHECAVIASNFLRYGEFWPEDAEPFADETVEPEFVGGTDPVAEALMPEVAHKYYPEPPPLVEPAIDPPRPVGRMTEDSHYPPTLPIAGMDV